MNQLQRELRGVDPRQLYPDPSTFHVTVKGLGQLGDKLKPEKLDSVLERVGRILSSCKMFDVEFVGVGMFPTSVYIQVGKGSEVLRAINKKLCVELGGEVDVSQYDGDSFLPHVTVATFNSRDVSALKSKIDGGDYANRSFGSAAVLELEAVEVRMHLALASEEVQSKAFSYIRSFPLH
jgi:2'-5' RNA ligase